MFLISSLELLATVTTVSNLSPPLTHHYEKSFLTYSPHPSEPGIEYWENPDPASAENTTQCAADGEDPDCSDSVVFGDTDAHLVVSFCFYVCQPRECADDVDDRDYDGFCSIMVLRIARHSVVDSSLLFSRAVITSCKRTYERNLRLQ